MTRREFICGAGASALAGCECPFRGCGGSKIRLAMAGHTLNRFKTDEALRFCEDHGFRYLCVKDFHLPFDSATARIAEFRRKCADHGVTPYGVGPIKMYTEDSAKKSFDYAAALGVDLIVGVPGRKSGPKGSAARSDRAMCETCSRLADEYRMRFAIHNHGRNPKTGNPNLYPAVPETYDLIGDLSPRMGFCVDWAYTFADGFDCADIARKYRDRIFDGHIRCLSDLGNGSSGVNPAGRVFDYDGIFAALKEIGYDGCLGLELANAFPDHPGWIDESREYFTGLIGR